MEIDKKAEGSKLTVKVSGRLDTTTAPVLDEELQASLDGVTELVFDLENLEYISSAGLRVLLSTLKLLRQRGDTMIVTHVNDTIMEIFEVTGFSDILTIQ